jgi:polyisoprenyl-teichoic acid--peptidoglycan teichoic acid transferase
MLTTGDRTLSWMNNIPVISQLMHLAESADKKLKGEERDRINILLLGIGGKGHDGGFLSDTIMLASLQPSSKKVSLISIPRDMTVPIENMGWRKVNHINAYAEFEKEGSGGLAVSQALSDILDTPIDYYIRVDFKGFVNLIDELGGINVYVDNAFTDYRYPISGRENASDYYSRFEVLSFNKGWQKMDGALALKYARSRHAAGIEGSDFARAKRQQKVIEAVKEKMLNKNLFFRPHTLSSIYQNYQENVSTNLKIWEMIKLWDMFKDVEKDKISNKVFDNSPNGLLINQISQAGAYILVPRSGDFAEIQYFVRNVFSEAPQEKKEKVKVDDAKLEVRNGTWINGLASKTALDLEKYGFDVIRIGNCSRQNFQTSVIYDLTYGEKLDSLSVLKSKTKANVSFAMPQWLIDDIKNDLLTESNPIQPDFILILGQDADKSASGTENLIN